MSHNVSVKKKETHNVAHNVNASELRLRSAAGTRYEGAK